MTIIVLFEQMKSGDFKDKVGKFLTDKKIFSENNPLSFKHAFLMLTLKSISGKVTN
jgi:hypothetical protein